MSDSECLQRFVRENSQSAFAALVERHVGLVYSAALRQVRSPQLAEEIAQSVFLDLARRAARLDPNQPLAAWLYLVTRRTSVDVIRRESRRLARESTAAEIAAMKTPPHAWSHVERALDDAMETLNESERTAILLRYFQQLSLREVGAALGISEDTAQKRVSRAVEQLRTFFVRRGLAVTAAGLASDLSAQALATAPASLSATITAATAGAAGVTHALAMTTMQKTVLTAAAVIVLGTGLYEATLFASQRSALDALQRDTAALAAQIRRAHQQSTATAQQLEAARAALNAAPPPSTDPASADPATAEIRAWLERVERLKQFARDSGKSIPEIALLSEQDWLNAAQNMDHDYGRGGPAERIDEALRGMRGLAKIRFGLYLGEASRAYVKAHDGQLPNDTQELRPYIKDNPNFSAAAVDDAMLARYAMRYNGALNEVPRAEQSAVIIEITSPDEEHDQRTINGPGGGRIRDFRNLSEDTNAALWAYAKANAGAKPVNPAELLPYFRPALSSARQEKFLQTASSLLPH